MLKFKEFFRLWTILLKLELAFLFLVLRINLQDLLLNCNHVFGNHLILYFICWLLLDSFPLDFETKFEILFWFILMSVIITFCLQFLVIDNMLQDLDFRDVKAVWEFVFSELAFGIWFHWIWGIKVWTCEGWFMFAIDALFGGNSANFCWVLLRSFSYYWRTWRGCLESLFCFKILVLIGLKTIRRFSRLRYNHLVKHRNILVRIFITSFLFDNLL